MTNRLNPLWGLPFGRPQPPFDDLVILRLPECSPKKDFVHVERAGAATLATALFNDSYQFKFPWATLHTNSIKKRLNLSRLLNLFQSRQ